HFLPLVPYTTLFRSCSFRRPYSSFVITSYRKPSGTAPDSPDITFLSSPAGFPSTRMPVALTESSHEAKPSATDFNISQPAGLGAPHDKPAIIESRLPCTRTGLPPSLFADW